MNRTGGRSAASDAFERAVELHRAGRLQEAKAAYRRLLRRDANNDAAMNALGILLGQTGDYTEAEKSLRRAIAIDSRNPAYHTNLGVALRRAGKLIDAIESYKRALALDGKNPDTLSNIGAALLKLGQPEGSVPYLEKAISVRPDSEDAYVNLSNALYALGRIPEAIDRARTAVQLAPSDAYAWSNLGLILLWQGMLDEATKSLTSAVNIDPANVSFRIDLGNCYFAIGDMDNAIRCAREALELDPSSPKARSNLLFFLTYTTIPRAELFREHRSVGERIEANLKRNWPNHRNLRDPARKLKIGYVSADFCEHALSYFTAPVLSRHDKSKFEIVCFDNGSRPDDVGKRFRQSADHWVPIAEMSDDRAAALIQGLGIDILVDLSGHTAGNRLPVFARKPAPVQVHWLGYIDTTGLEAMDYRITDSRLDPPDESDRYYTESQARLPIACAFEPFQPSPDVNPLPGLSGAFTFACLNRLAKITPEVVECWVRVLGAVPDAFLLLGWSDNPGAKSRLIRLFGEHGVSEQRIRFLPKLNLTNYMKVHGEIDLALDPFPYNGGATSCHSMWMGVPLVALRGDRYMARMGADLLENVGLDEFVADDPDRYVEIAVGFANRRKELAEIRRTLRQRFLASPLGRPDQFVSKLETAYRAIWQAWCADPKRGFSHRGPAIVVGN